MSLYTFAEPDLASRQAAARLRAHLEERARGSDREVIDLDNVLTLGSCGDELFGVLVAGYGLGWFAAHLSIRRALPTVFRTIANVESGRSWISMSPPQSCIHAHQNLPDPDALAAEIVKNLEAALEQFREIAEDLNGAKDETARTSALTVQATAKTARREKGY